MQEVTDAVEQGKKFLQMPPYMKPWSEKSEILSEDPDIEGFDTEGVNYVFTDITYGLPPDVSYSNIKIVLHFLLI